VQLVARFEGRVIGWCDILPRDGAPQGCGIVGMGIVDGHRGQGLGRRLLARAIAAARAKGMTQIQLDVRAANTAAIALYKKLGFVEQSRYFRDDPGLEGELIVMALPQDAAA
jgi:ribosomal protein S18 acetylase RimI-like enzyme